MHVLASQRTSSWYRKVLREGDGDVGVWRGKYKQVRKDMQERHDIQDMGEKQGRQER
jgi:hypothetical protein